MQQRRTTITTAIGIAGLATTAAIGVAGAADARRPDASGLTPLGVYDSGAGEGGSEIVAVDPATRRMFITNGALDAVDIVDISDPGAPALFARVDLTPFGDGVQSVAVGTDLAAAAVKAADDLGNGSVVVFDLDGDVQGSYEVGNLPDSIAFTPDGRRIVVANEAEPVCDGETLLADPEGSISIIDLHAGAVRTADFGAWVGHEDELRERGVRIFFPGSTAAQDLEPEYVTIADHGRTAFVTLQENNAVAVVDIRRARVQRIVPLGYEDHSRPHQGLDPSNEDGPDDGPAVQIGRWDVLGMYMPDAIADVRLGWRTYLVTANEGDARDYDCYSEEIRVKDVGLGAAYADGDDADGALGRLKTTTAFPTTFDDQGRIEQVYSYGTRSFTIWTQSGQVVFDSGDQFEQILADTPFFNLDDDEFDGRSDDKGPEPEALAVGRVGRRTYAFIGLERSGGIMMYDITNPRRARFVDYVNTAEVGADGVPTLGGDISPEGIAFVPAWRSPTGRALLAVAYEVSGTTRLFEIG